MLEVRLGCLPLHLSPREAEGSWRDPPAHCFLLSLQQNRCKLERDSTNYTEMFCLHEGAQTQSLSWQGAEERHGALQGSYSRA